jgi:hypothetical protein
MSDPLAAARQRVEAEQAQLLRALVASGGAPPGFDLPTLMTQAAALRQKRKRMMAITAPDLVAKLDLAWDEVFECYARQHPPATSRRLTDAATFRRWLRRRKE